MVMINTIGVLRAIASQKVNASFSVAASLNAHKALAYPEKRASAETLLSGGAATDELIAEANLRGITVEALAQTIVSKPLVSIAQQELERQKLMMQIEASNDPQELDALLKGLGVGGLNG